MSPYDKSERAEQWALKAKAHDLAKRLSALRVPVSRGQLDLDQVEKLVQQLEALESTTKEA